MRQAYLLHVILLSVRGVGNLYFWLVSDGRLSWGNRWEHWRLETDSSSIRWVHSDTARLTNAHLLILQLDLALQERE